MFDTFYVGTSAIVGDQRKLSSIHKMFFTKPVQQSLQTIFRRFRLVMVNGDWSDDMVMLMTIYSD